MNATLSHPLLNSDSSHYSMVDGVEAITRLEQMYTAEELAIWAKITAMKYRLRVGNKDVVEKESKKIKTFEAYYKYLTINIQAFNKAKVTKEYEDEESENHH